MTEKKLKMHRITIFISYCIRSPTSQNNAKEGKKEEIQRQTERVSEKEKSEVTSRKYNYITQTIQHDCEFKKHRNTQTTRTNK